MPLKVKRLETLIDVLENIPPKKFSLEKWMDIYSEFDEDDRVFKPSKDDGKTLFDAIIADDSVKYTVKDGGEKIKVFPVQPMECQMAGCAMGWAAADKRFNRLGLTLAVDAKEFKNKSINEYSSFIYLAMIDKKSKTAILDESRMAETLFGFKEEPTWRYLFYKGRYSSVSSDPTPKMVAKRIRLLIKLGETEFLKKWDILHTDENSI